MVSNTLLENPDLSMNSVWEGAVYLIPSLVELYNMFKNSSTTVGSDGFVKVDGVYENCTTDSRNEDAIDYSFMGLSVLFLIIFSFFMKRVSFKKHILWGRPGPVLPMGMLDSHEHIIEFTLAFLSVSEDIYSFIFGFKSDFGKQLPIVKFFIKLLVVVALSLSSYLTFAGLQNRYLIGYVFGATMSLCYSIGGIKSSFTFSNCLSGTKTIPFIFSAVVYSFIDLTLLVIFVYKIVTHVITHGLRMKTVNQENSTDRHFCVRYVRMLLKERHKEREEKLEEDDIKPFIDLLKCDKLKEKISEKVYKEIPGFSIPPRLIIGISVGLFFAYRIFIDQIYSMTPTVWNFMDLIINKYGSTNTNLKDAFHIIIANSTSYSKSDYLNAYRFLTFFYAHLLIGCALTAIILGFLNSIVHSFLILRNYRLNFQKITTKGFSSMINLDRAPPPYALILGFVRFSGYQAAYILWGILVVFFMTTLLLYFLIGFFLLPLFYVENSWSRRFVINYGPVILASIILNFIQTLIVKNIFVKEKGDLMEINNRRAFIIYSHCAFFLNALMGLFTSIKRIIIWTFSGVICFCRIDFTSLPEYLQGCDNGYMCYIGFLYTEQFHHNPILRSFANILLESRRDRTTKLKSDCGGSLEDDSLDIIPKYCPRYRNKWRVAYTLIRNQSLLAQRKNFLFNNVI